MSEPIQFDNSGCVITPRIAEWLVARAFPSGVPVGMNLFWVVGNAQRLQIINSLQLVSDPRDSRYEAEHGMARNGLLVGIPYFLDPTLPEDQIRLQVITHGDCVGVIRNNSIGPEDHKAAEARKRGQDGK